MSTPRWVPRARKNVQKQLMRDTCTLRPLGGAEISSVCGVVDPKRTPDQPLERAERAQLQIRGSIVFRLPVSTPDMPLGSGVTYGGRGYTVVDPGAPVHSLMLARYIGCEEVPG